MLIDQHLCATRDACCTTNGCCICTQVQEEARVGGALTALRVLTRKYEFRDSEERGPLGPLLATALPALLTIFQVGGRSCFE